MKRFTLYATALTLSTSLSLATPKAAPLDETKAPTPTLSAMQAGEKSIVNYQSQGCKHRLDYTLTFIAATPMMVTIEQNIDSSDAQYREKETKRTATLTLSPEEVTSLDKTISYYRSNPQGACTTYDHITIAWYQNETGQKQESYRDETCGVADEPKLTFWALIKRILPGPK